MEGRTSVGCMCETGFFGRKTACFDGNAAAPAITKTLKALS